MKRRNFLEAISGTVTGTALFGSVALENIQAAAKRTAHLSPQEAARDESLWRGGAKCVQYQPQHYQSR